MKMLRGASVFLILVFVAVFVECKKEASVGNTETTATTETSTSGSMAAITLTHNLCMPAGKHVCPNDPCVIEVKVKDNDNSVHAEKVWLYEGQKIRWTPKPDHHPAPGDPEPKVEQIRFVDNTTTDAQGKQPNDKAHAPANCATHPTDCYLDAVGFTRCKEYRYIAVVFHKNQHKKSDPEIEIGSTTSPYTDTSGTSTSGTSGTHP